MLYYFCKVMQTSESVVNKGFSIGCIVYEGTTLGTTKQVFRCFLLLKIALFIFIKSMNTTL